MNCGEWIRNCNSASARCWKPCVVRHPVDQSVHEIPEDPQDRATENDEVRHRPMALKISSAHHANSESAPIALGYSKAGPMHFTTSSGHAMETY